MSILQKNSLFAGKYTVLLFIKKSKNAETYRVRGSNNKLYFLKLFNTTQLNQANFDNNANLLAIELLKTIKHPNIVAYHDSGETVINNCKYLYLMEEFIVGETLLERLAHESIFTLYDIRHILSDVLKGLSYLHSLPNAIIHNEITPQNIMLDLAAETSVAKIIDFGYARTINQSQKEYKLPINSIQYVANECITKNIFLPQSDLYSVGVVMYQMLFGKLPWKINKIASETSNMETNFATSLLDQRQEPLLFPNIVGQIIDFDDSILNVLEQALQNDPEQRFKNAQLFLQALTNQKSTPWKEFVAPANTTVEENKLAGFAAIAGMQELKKKLQSDVIDMLRNPELYRLHQLALPNGMLLYGPPGCGKTFFAKKFAEETGYNFVDINPSDIASVYIHGTQEKIRKIFDNAKENAPTILNFNEISTMMPSRENISDGGHSHYAGETNEFLAQLDNIGNSGVFVIGSTNQPHLIDKAILRAGRLEKHFYIPPPDREARRAMFELYLKNRPITDTIDYERLAMLTENYVSGDIKLIVDETSRKTIKEHKEGKRKDTKITMDDLELIIKTIKSSISTDDLKKIEQIKAQMENIKQERPKIGFLN